MNEIIKIMGMLFFIVIFRYLSWLQFIILALTSNGLQYCYQNKKSLKKFIRKQNKNLTMKKAMVIMALGMPLILIDIFTKFMGLLAIVWNLFVKTNVGRGIETKLNKGDKYIKDKKSEMKSKVIQYVIQKSMPGLAGNKDIKLPDFGNMEGLGDLFKNPEEMGKMMESLGKVMGKLDVDNMQKLSSSSEFKKDTVTRPVIEDDLFNKINKYIEDETTSVNINSANEGDEQTIELKNQIIRSKNINRKMRKRIKNKNKKNINKQEFNDMKNLTKALQDVVNQLDVD
jgi:hypothetical protein